MGYQALVVLHHQQIKTAELSALLARCGFGVSRACGDDAAVSLLRARRFDIVVVSADDPAVAELCSSLRAYSSAPIVALCGRRDETVATRCLQAGADSVLTGPTPRRELTARLFALMAKRSSSQLTAPDGESFRIGDLLIDRDAHLARKANSRLALTPTEFRLLLALARRAGSVVRHTELLSEVWGEADASGSKNLRLYVRYLRQKLGDDRRQPRLLLNQRGIGYKLATDATAGIEKGNLHGDSEDAHAGTRHALRARSQLAPLHG